MEYKLLGKTGIWVSRLCLGTMTFGGKGYWEPIGKLQQTEADHMIKAAFDAGITFFDTADVYGEGDAERILGKSLQNLGLSRQELVIATKVRGRTGKGMNQVGLSRGHIMDAVNDSLERLNLDHIDLYYIHGFDANTPFEETMRGLEDVVRSGKVRYIGCSNLPAWQIMKCNSFAEKLGWTRFDALQHFYSIAGRDVEREIIPMAESENLALMPWSPLAGGFLTGKFSRDTLKSGDDARRNTFDFPLINKQKAFGIIDKMKEIAEDHGATVPQIALSWLLCKKAVTSVIIGAKHPEQLQDNINSIKVKLTGEEISILDDISALTLEYPQWMIERQNAVHARKD